MKHPPKEDELARPGSGYLSDFEQFMNGYLAQHPEVEQDRREGWYIWWDHRLDLADLDGLHANELPVKPYPYE